MKAFQTLAALLLLLAGLPGLRAAENVSKAQVLAAIEAAEASRGRTFPQGSCSAELQIGATSLSNPSAGLIVTQIKFDPALGQARFLLRARGESKAPPFFAWCSYQADDAREPAARNRPSVASVASAEHSLGPVLVDVHRAARLYLHSPNSAAVLAVKPLQPGHKGELIRVRLPLYGKMIEARVTGTDTLEATF